MPNGYPDQKLYSEEEILDILIGLDNVYQSQSWLGRLFWRKWHMALETLAMQLTGNVLVRREAVKQAEDIMLREEGYEDEDE